MTKPKVMGLQPSELEIDALRKAMLDLRRENDDLYREVDAMRRHRDGVRELLRSVWRVVESYRSPVTDGPEEEHGLRKEDK